MPMVSFLGIFMMLSLVMVFRSTLVRRDQASKTQLRLDYHQREEALMRALVATFPKKVVACMKGDYAASTTYDWNAVFADAIARAAAAEALSGNLVGKLGIAEVRRGDVGDDTAATVQSWITSLQGVAGQVTPGTSTYSTVFADPKFAGKVPPLLKASSATELADQVRPIVSSEKVYSTQDPGLLAGIANYPKFNLIPYPNIRFGYASPGEPFVAKRNWWAFTVRYGEGVGMTKHYVLSLYEVPSQLPIEAATFAEIGKHQDGTTWGAGITIDGGVYADSLKMNGAHGASRLAGRESIELTQALTLDGTTVEDDFDALGVREQMQATARTNLLPIALSANSGRVVFYPLPSGLPFLSVPTGTTTKWDVYKGGGIDCKVQVEAIAMVSLANQTPTSIRVKFATAAGTNQTVVLTRGSNWPTAEEPGGDALPFQTELTNSNRSCLTFSPALLNAWLQTNGGAIVDVNNSVHFSVNAALDPLTVKPVASPPADVDMCVIIRKGKDLTSFTKGLSVVGPLRVYIGDDLNDVAMAAAPTGSGLPTGSTFYPPMSIFAAELRVGTTAFNRPFDHHGQMGSLQSGGTAAWRPMDMKSGSDEAVHSDEIEADLTPLLSPAELPPIHQMNWLVVVEEIPQT
ncbi:MAG TPA: hypothetical protein VK956_17345 [Verrucomicrobium sp.]|nr:hypothetical protein [Verrucomicrobium sp.]